MLTSGRRTGGVNAASPRGEGDAIAESVELFGWFQKPVTRELPTGIQ
jgi:hypothetical protein